MYIARGYEQKITLDFKLDVYVAFEVFADF